MTPAAGDLVIAPAAGLPNGLVIPAGELTERFSRSSGPGGQGVNTTDSRVELVFDPASSTALTPGQRRRLVSALAGRLVDGAIVITASEHRQQLRNRTAARDRLAELVCEALAPPPPPRRATKPTKGSQARRVNAKKQRGAVKARRGRVSRADE